MGSSSYNLLCVAHPDDETIFFGGLIQRRKTRPWRIICVTDGNADGHGRKRFRQFERACRTLGVKDFEWWGFPDIFEKRLPVDQLRMALAGLPEPAEVYTHGILGEYGHPHHQDVSYAVHTAFRGHGRVYSPAYNAFPEIRLQLTRTEFARKTKILTDIYGSETSRFLNLLPGHALEGYVRLRATEVEALYDYLARNKRLRAGELHAFAWMEPYLRGMTRNPKRLF